MHAALSKLCPTRKVKYVLFGMVLLPRPSPEATLDFRGHERRRHASKVIERFVAHWRPDFFSVIAKCA